MTGQPLGIHLIADLDGCTRLDDLSAVEAALRAAVEAAGVHLIGLKLHHFGPGQGVTGVALLAESHISIHTWPERAFAAVDIFVCAGEAQARRGLEALVAHLSPTAQRVTAIPRGPP